MFNDVTPILKILFTKDDAPPRQPLVFEWWLIRRRGRPFLLLPTSPDEAHVALELYSAQRFYAKIMRAVLPLILKTPAAKLFSQVRLPVDPASELVQFMAQQSGVPIDRLRAPAIKVNGLGLQKARLVMLLCDEAKRPAKVVKVGINPEGWLGLHPDGWKATEQEANQLELLPPNKIGCIRLTGRISAPALSAFATTYFSGDSPRNDEGMEQLFHSWLNPLAPVPIQSLNSWRELEAVVSKVDPQIWSVLNAAVAEKKVHSTLHHGDFAPWNIRATSDQNLQVFDWESAQTQGIPGWDWFHFFVQTAILVKRNPEKKVAAEVEHLFQSPRFQIYADTARIRDIVKPLFLAYLLHQKYVAKPLDGGQTTEKLYELLAVRWQLKPAVPADEVAAKPSFPTSVRGQLKFALAQLSNLIWEPTLTSVRQPTMWAQLRAHPKLILMNVLLLGAVISLQFRLGVNAHLSFIPFYLAPCVWLVLKLDRRWAGLLATAAAIAGPWLRHLINPDFLPLEVTLWNIVMRFILFQLVIVLMWRIRGQNIFSNSEKSEKPLGFAETFAAHWAVIIAAGLFFIGVMWVDATTTPQLNLLPLYLLPCMVLTLVVDRRWGSASAIITAVAGPFVMRFEDAYYCHFTVEFWNTLAHLLVFQLVVFVLDCIRRDDVLFWPAKPEVELPPTFSPTTNSQFVASK